MAANPTTKALADGQLANVKGTLYTSPALTKTIIKSIVLTNTSASAVTVNLYYKVSAGTSRRITPVNFSLAAESTLFWGGDTEMITLDAAGVIEGDASSATTVDYTISGAQET